jgi:hypothetical protein
MQSLEAAILRTVLYADVFNFPMKPEEIHHFLIGDEPASLPQVQHTLHHSAWLRQYVEWVDQFVVYAGRSELIGVRKAREQASQALWPQAVVWGKRLAQLPFVRMVALTGALAVRNAADHDDDLDYILVTAANRVWIARAFAILMVRIGRLWGVILCPNFVLSESALAQSREDIFTAHEVAQMVPVYGQDVYRRFREENEWVYNQLPNALDPFFDEAVVESKSNRITTFVKQCLELILSGSGGDWLENWEYHRKLRRFAADMEKPHSSAKLDNTQVKGHFDDHGHPVLQKYYARLRECGLESQPLALTGD